MTATQLPKPGDRFRWVGFPNGQACVVVIVDEFNVYYRTERGLGSAGSRGHWQLNAIPLAPKPHVEPVQWGVIKPNGQAVLKAHINDARETAKIDRLPLAKLVNGVLFLEVDGEFVKAFGGDE